VQTPRHLLTTSIRLSSCDYAQSWKVGPAENGIVEGDWPEHCGRYVGM